MGIVMAVSAAAAAAVAGAAAGLSVLDDPVDGDCQP